MENVPSETEARREPDVFVHAPMQEALVDVALAAAIWPDACGLLDQVGERQQVVERTNTFFEALPIHLPPIEQLLADGAVQEADAALLYEDLAALLENEDSERLVLYLPFELLPPPWLDAETPELAAASDRFRTAYVSAWSSQLSVHDVRANFVNGDVVELPERSGEPARVVKAAHMIPALVERGMLDLDDLFELYDRVEDPLLRQNMGEAFNILKDAGFAIADQYVRAVLEQALAPVTPLFVTERRRQWLEEEAQAQKVLQISDQIAIMLLLDPAAWDTTQNLLRMTGNPALQQAGIEGIRSALEQVAETDMEAAQNLYKDTEPNLVDAWINGDPSSQQLVQKLFRRLHRAGVIERSVLDNIGVSLPDLGGRFSENTAYMEAEIAKLTSFTDLLAADEELAKIVYPAVQLYGSRLKGYGSSHSDIDVGIYLRPGSPAHERTAVRTILYEKMQAAGFDYEPIEFWLDESPDGLAIHDFNDADPHVADSLFTHMLFGGAWLGHEDAVSMLTHKLIPRYFAAATESLDGRPLRALYLEAMERDLLQYRLLHKGYERAYPMRKKPSLPHGDLIDADAAYWDPGYRLVASKLFINKVFLPKVS